MKGLISTVFVGMDSGTMRCVQRFVDIEQNAGSSA